MLAERLRDHDDTPVDDEIVVVRGPSWSDYQRLLEVRGEEVPGSRVLPGIDLEQLVSFLDRPSASQAMREYRAAPAT